LFLRSNAGFFPKGHSMYSVQTLYRQPQFWFIVLIGSIHLLETCIFSTLFIMPKWHFQSVFHRMTFLCNDDEGLLISSSIPIRIVFPWFWYHSKALWMRFGMVPKSSKYVTYWYRWGRQKNFVVNWWKFVMHWNSDPLISVLPIYHNLVNWLVRQSLPTWENRIGANGCSTQHHIMSLCYSNSFHIFNYFYRGLF
jgi:hypothetical protein